MKHTIESDVLKDESLSAHFDGISDEHLSNQFTDSDREKWEIYALISDVMGNDNVKDIHLSSFADKVRSKVLNEPTHSKYELSSMIYWLKYQFKKLPILVAAPALAFGLVVVVIQPTNEQVSLADEGDMPRIMDTYCQLHENGTGGAALC
jgi:negative regulator of sigma E activity